MHTKTKEERSLWIFNFDSWDQEINIILWIFLDFRQYIVKQILFISNFAISFSLCSQPAYPFFFSSYGIYLWIAFICRRVMGKEAKGVRVEAVSRRNMVILIQITMQAKRWKLIQTENLLQGCDFNDSRNRNYGYHRDLTLHLFQLLFSGNLECFLFLFAADRTRIAARNNELQLYCTRWSSLHLSMFRTRL